MKRKIINDNVAEIIFSELPKQLEEKKLSFLAEYFNFKPELYTIWNLKSMDHGTSHFGAFPLSFMQNLLYYHTNPFDVVYDPFAGGVSSSKESSHYLKL